jgi:integrase
LKRRANHEGSEPMLRKDGRWQAKWWGPDGKRHVVTLPVGSTKTACREALRAAIRRSDEGSAPLDGRLTVGRWLDIWLKKYVAGGTRPRRPRTVESYQSVANVHLKPRLGRIVLAKLTREQVSDALSGVAAAGAAPGTVRHVFNILRIALNEAVRSDAVRQNVVLKVPAPVGMSRSFSPWDADEINAFLDAITGDSYAPLFTLAIASGLRQGELLGLAWSDIDLDARTLTVRRQYTRQGTMTDPKSAAGKRTIGLNDVAVWSLRAQSARQARDRLAAGAEWANDHNLVFAGAKGAPLNHRVTWWTFRDRTVKAGVRPIRFHDLRHACATLLLTGGEDLAVISKVLGHSDYSTTLRVYAHLDPSRARAAANRIDQALRRTLPTVEEAAAT